MCSLPRNLLSVWARLGWKCVPDMILTLKDYHPAHQGHGVWLFISTASFIVLHYLLEFTTTVSNPSSSRFETMSHFFFFLYVKKFLRLINIIQL